MHNWSAALIAHLATENPTIAHGVKIKRKDGTIMGFTDNDVDRVISGLTYSAEGAVLASNTEHSSDLSVDNMEAQIRLTSAAVTEADVEAGVYDYAEYWFFLYNFMDLSMGIGSIQHGNLGEMQMDGKGSYNIEFRSLTQRLQQVIGRTYQIDCDEPVGSTKCGINLEIDTAWVADTIYAENDYVSSVIFDGRRYKCTTAGTSGGTEPNWDTTVGNTTNDGTAVWTCEDKEFVVAGAVTSVTDNRVFIDSARTEEAGYFDGAVLTWLTGNNAGRRMEVRAYDLAATSFALFEAMPENVQVGDLYRVHAGCDKSFAMCKARYNNGNNHRGNPHTPGPDAVVRRNGA